MISDFGKVELIEVFLFFQYSKIQFRLQKLDILEGDLPSSTSTLTITGAEAVQLGANSLSRLVDARFIQIYDTKIILMRKFSGVKLAITSLMLDIDRCDVLRIEENTFSSIKGNFHLFYTSFCQCFIHAELKTNLLDIQ